MSPDTILFCLKREKEKRAMIWNEMETENSHHFTYDKNTVINDIYKQILKLWQHNLRS